MPATAGQRTTRQKLLFCGLTASFFVTVNLLINLALLQHTQSLRCFPADKNVSWLNSSLELDVTKAQQPLAVSVSSTFGSPSFTHRFVPHYDGSKGYVPSPSPISEYALFPRASTPWIDIDPYVTRGAAMVTSIANQCSWPTFYWDYRQLEHDGYIVNTETATYGSQWDRFLESIGAKPGSEVIRWGCGYPDEEEEDSDGNDVINQGFLVEFDLDHGVMLMGWTYRPTIHPGGIVLRLSDIAYLGWQQMATEHMRHEFPLPKYYLVESVSNQETLQIIENCLRDDPRNKNPLKQPPTPPWPGKIWTTDEECGKALLASPSGRGLAYLILNHLSVPEGVTGAEEAIPLKGLEVTGVRLFASDDNQVNLVFYIGDLGRHERRELAAYPTTGGLVRHGTATPSQHVQSRVPPDDYSRWLLRGTNALAAIRSQCAAQSLFTDPDNLEAGGYAQTLQSDIATDTALWAGFLADLGLTREHLFIESTVRREGKEKEIKRHWVDGRYQFLFDLTRGIVITSIMYRATRPYPETVVNMSDILFLAWQKACTANNIESPDINYYLVDDIINFDTIRTIKRACIQTVPLWPGVDFDIDTPCGKAVLGTPSGIALAYLLAQHTDAFPDKEIGYVRIFDSSFGTPNLAFFLGTSENRPEPPARPPPAEEPPAAAPSTTSRKVRFVLETPTPAPIAKAEVISALAKRDALYDGCRVRGQRFISVIANQDECTLPPTQFPNYEALAQAGYETQARSPYWAAGVWQGFILSVGGAGATSTQFVHWSAVRELYSPYDGQSGHRAIIRSGAFVADFQFELGIMLMAQTYASPNPAPNTVVRLSDIIWLGWKHQAKQNGFDNPTIKYFLVDGVINRQTDRVVFQALGARDRTFDHYPGTTFSVTDEDEGDAFYAILGTPSGRGIAWMIINHADDLPRKVVNSVTVFKCDLGGTLLCLIFPVVDLPPPEKPKPAEGELPAGGKRPAGHPPAGAPPAKVPHVAGAPPAKVPHVAGPPPAARGIAAAAGYGIAAPAA